jgi:DNA-directed RNA polymerase subunit RPC12/RpoP
VPITERETAEYMETNGQHCPNCQSNDLDCDRIQVDNDTAWQEIRCEQCKSTWIDLYMLSDIVNFKRGC